jgi:hypothetical protein
VTCQAWFFYWWAASAWSKPLLESFQLNIFLLLAFSWTTAFLITLLVKQPQLKLPNLKLKLNFKKKPKRENQEKSSFEL